MMSAVVERRTVNHFSFPPLTGSAEIEEQKSTAKLSELLSIIIENVTWFRFRNARTASLDAARD
jgi:hypothetical protein